MSVESEQTGAGVSRRDFMAQFGLLASLAAACPVSALAADRPPPMPAWSADEPWSTLAAVQEHLFPATPDAPGARDLGAIVYLRNTLETPHADGEDKTFVIKGVGWLNDLVREETQTAFVALNEAGRETMLRRIEQSRAGRRWLSLLLTYLLEALLADPVYGGNPGGVGWKWLQHRPGFPRPPADKIWYRLAAPVHFNRKSDA